MFDLGAAGLDPSTSIGAAGAFAAAVGAVYVSWRNGQKITEVHYMVNARLDSALERIEQLTEALEGSDTEVPAVTSDTTGGRHLPRLQQPAAVVATPVDPDPNKD